MQTVILTNAQGESLGETEKVKAHLDGGMLHKAFSVFIFTPDKKKLLLQRRASTKMLWPGYWSNTCCSHPKEEFPLEVEAADRLREECSFLCGLEVVGSFVYKADDPEGRGTEYEHDTVLIGFTDQETALDPNPDEVMELKWVGVEGLREEMKEKPEEFTPWFKEGLEMIVNK